MDVIAPPIRPPALATLKKSFSVPVPALTRLMMVRLSTRTNGRGLAARPIFKRYDPKKPLRRGHIKSRSDPRHCRGSGPHPVIRVLCKPSNPYARHSGQAIIPVLPPSTSASMAIRPSSLHQGGHNEQTVVPADPFASTAAPRRSFPQVLFARCF